MIFLVLLLPPEDNDVSSQSTEMRLLNSMGLLFLCFLSIHLTETAKVSAELSDFICVSLRENEKV